MWVGPQGAASMGRPGYGADAAYAVLEKFWGPLECPCPVGVSELPTRLI